MGNPALIQTFVPEAATSIPADLAGIDLDTGERFSPEACALAGEMVEMVAGGQAITLEALLRTGRWRASVIIEHVGAAGRCAYDHMANLAAAGGPQAEAFAQSEIMPGPEVLRSGPPVKTCVICGWHCPARSSRGHGESKGARCQCEA